MARQKISEFKAKSLLYAALGQKYSGIFYQKDSNLPILPVSESFVVKVDVGVKKRFKNGLVYLNVRPEEVKKKAQTLFDKGYAACLIEPETKHDSKEERYLALSRERSGIMLSYSEYGGVEIESQAQTVSKEALHPLNLATMAKKAKLSTEVLVAILDCFEQNYFSFLEINPYLVQKGKFIMLDCAVEVDDTAEFFVSQRWTKSDLLKSQAKECIEIKQVEDLAHKSQAAFSLTLLNENGELGMLLSSGGASIVLADEAGNLGYGQSLINYGEYSGNPNAEETYLYARSILSLLLKSKAKKKALVIAGAVANFTDIRITFTGVIKALAEVAEALREQKVLVFVRRGGPNQEEGLAKMEKFLKQEKIFGDTKGPEMVLTEIMHEAIDYIRR